MGYRIRKQRTSKKINNLRDTRQDKTKTKTLRQDQTRLRQDHGRKRQDKTKQDKQTKRKAKKTSQKKTRHDKTTQQDKRLRGGKVKEVEGRIAESPWKKAYSIFTVLDIILHKQKSVRSI